MSGMTMSPEDLQYGLDVTGLDPASLGDALRAVSRKPCDPARMMMWMGSVSVSQQTAGLNLLRRLSGEKVDSASNGDKRFADPAWIENPLLAGMLEDYYNRSKAR